MMWLFQEQQHQICLLFPLGMNTFTLHSKVHIGKAGGGGGRARIAASALDYNSTGTRKAWNDNIAQSYYPICEEQDHPENDNSNSRVLHKGRLINSRHGNMLPHHTWKRGRISLSSHVQNGRLHQLSSNDTDWTCRGL